MLLRIKTLAEYRYPWWQVLLLLAVISASGVGLQPLPLHTTLLNKLLFIIVLKAMTLVQIDITLRFWLSRNWARARGFSAWDGRGRFLTVLVLAASPSFFTPLLLLVNPVVAALLFLLLLAASIVIPVYAVARTVNARSWYVLIGFVLSLPLLLWISVISFGLLVEWGWLLQADIDAMNKQMADLLATMSHTAAKGPH